MSDSCNMRIPESPGPWGNSPKEIASWFGPNTKLRVIVNSILDGDTESIARINSLCITLGLSHRIYPETAPEDIECFMNFLGSEHYMNDFSERVSNVLLEKLPFEESEDLRSFLERIRFGQDIPTNALLTPAECGERDSEFDLNAEVLDAVLAMCKSLGIVGSIYYIMLIFRILGLV